MENPFLELTMTQGTFQQKFEYTGAKYRVLCKSTCKGFKWIILDFRKRKWKTSFLLIVVNLQQVWQWAGGLNGILNTWIEDTVMETSDRAKLVVYFGSRFFCSITPIGQCVDYSAGKMS